MSNDDSALFIAARDTAAMFARLTSNEQCSEFIKQSPFGDKMETTLRYIVAALLSQKDETRIADFFGISIPAAQNLISWSVANIIAVPGSAPSA